MAGGLLFLSLLFHLLIFGSLLPALLILPFYSWLKFKTPRSAGFFVKHFPLWGIPDLFGLFYIAEFARYGDATTLRAVLVAGAIFIVAKAILYSALLLRRDLLKAILLVFVLQMSCFTITSVLHTQEEHRNVSKTDLYYSNLVEFQDALYIARAGEQIFQRSMEKQWIPVAKLPPDIVEPILTATQEELFLMGFREQKGFDKSGDKKFPQLFRLKEKILYKVEDSHRLEYIGFMGADGYQIQGAENWLWIVEEEHLSDEIWLLKGDQLLKTDPSRPMVGMPMHYQGKWYGFKGAEGTDGDYIVEFSWNPEVVQEEGKIVQDKIVKRRIIPIKILNKLFTFPRRAVFPPRFYLIKDGLYASNGATLYRYDQQKFSSVLEVDLGDETSYSIRDVVGDDKVLWISLYSHVDGSNKILKVDFNQPESDGKLELLPFPPALANQFKIRISSILLKDGMLYVSFEKFGVFAWSAKGWEKMEIE